MKIYHYCEKKNSEEDESEYDNKEMLFIEEGLDGVMLYECQSCGEMIGILEN